MMAFEPWWRRSIDTLMDFIQAVLTPARGRRSRRGPDGPLALPGPGARPGEAQPQEDGPLGELVPFPRADLPCELLLTNGHGAVRVFAAGTVDEFAYFQRAGVPEHTEVEWLTRLDREDAGTEAFKPYGMFRLRQADGQPLPKAGDLPPEFWAALQKEHGLVRLLPAARVLVRRSSAWDPRRNGAESGMNRFEAADPEKVWKRVRGRRYTHADLLEVLRRHLRGPERIAWLESAIPDALEKGQILHRYYLDAGRRLWLVRHHWLRGKSLHKAQTSDEAKRLLVISGALPRRQAA